MTGIKISFYALGAVGGVASPAISGDSTVNLTLALVAGGIGGTAVAAWKVARAWYAMEAEVKILRAEVDSLKKSRAAALREKLTELEGRNRDDA
jgi:hypothetical protein